MAKLNKPVSKPPIYTHEGAKAVHIKPIDQLRRSVMSALLFEKEFYEDGESIADRVQMLAASVDPAALAALAIEARHKFKLRHMPLLLLAVLTRTGAGRADGLVRHTIAQVIDRADELAEFVAVLEKLGSKTLSGQTKKGLAAAFNKFDAYGLKKYDRDGAWKLRDVAFLAHVKPKTKEHALNLARLLNKERFPENTKASTYPVAASLHPDGFEKLKAADTWEVALSAGRDKKTYWTEVLEKTAAPEFVRGSLSYLALLRNLRNMLQAGVDTDLIRKALAKGQGIKKVLPFRFITAARHAPQLEPDLDKALVSLIAQLDPLPGKTIVLVDVSGSMNANMSGKSELSRMDAAAVLASIIPGDVRVFTFSRQVVEVPPRKGMAGVDAIKRSQQHGGTYLGEAMKAINALPHDRLIVVTDEQSYDPVAAPVAKKAYMVNVASYKNGVGYGKGWTAHIDGFSERVLTYIREVEGLDSDPSAGEEETD